MLSKLYAFFHRLFAKPEERDEYSRGYWQDKIRRESLNLCRSLNGRVLEIGCGEGLFLSQLAGYNPHLEIYGVDNNRTRLEQAQKRCQEKNLRNINFSLQEATSLSFKDEYFDAVICINVIFNLESSDIAKEALREMARVCRRKGKVIFDFRNSANPLIRLKYKLAPLYDQTLKGLPLNAYRLEELRLFSEEAGLYITNKIYIGLPIKRIAPVIILEAEKI